jgi:hypothetical protein
VLQLGAGRNVVGNVGTWAIGLRATGKYACGDMARVESCIYGKIHVGTWARVEGSPLEE